MCLVMNPLLKSILKLTIIILFRKYAIFAVVCHCTLHSVVLIIRKVLDRARIFTWSTFWRNFCFSLAQDHVDWICYCSGNLARR